MVVCAWASCTATWVACGSGHAAVPGGCRPGRRRRRPGGCRPGRRRPGGCRPGRRRLGGCWRRARRSAWQGSTSREQHRDQRQGSLSSEHPSSIIILSPFRRKPLRAHENSVAGGPREAKKSARTAAMKALSRFGAVAFLVAISGGCPARAKSRARAGWGQHQQNASALPAALVGLSTGQVRPPAGQMPRWNPPRPRLPPPMARRPPPRSRTPPPATTTQSSRIPPQRRLPPSPAGSRPASSPPAGPKMFTPSGTKMKLLTGESACGRAWKSRELGD